MNKELTSEGGWPASDMRAWLRDSILPLFPDTVRSNIKEVKKYSYSFSDSGTISSSDMIWIPSHREVYGAEESKEYDGPVYLAIFSPISRIRLRAGEPESWWLRSADSQYDRWFDGVNSGGAGNSGGNAYLKEGVLVGFCL